MCTVPNPLHLKKESDFYEPRQPTNPSFTNSFSALHLTERVRSSNPCCAWWVYISIRGYTLSQILSRLCILLREYEVATRVVRGGRTYPLGVTLRVSVNVFWENYLYVLGNCKCILPVTFQSRDTPPIDRRMKAHARGHVRREREKLREDTGRVAF